MSISPFSGELLRSALKVSLDLTQLFDTPCQVSYGEVHPEDVSQLPALHPDECPQRFSTWAEKRRREFLAGRYHARLALALAGRSPCALPRDPDGVPAFPPGVTGSITHTGREVTFAAAVVTTTGANLGLDAEERRSLPSDMSAHILSEGERANLARRPTALRVEGLKSDGELSLLAFSAKEAFYKAIFPRLRCRLGFHDVHFELRAVETGAGPLRGQFDLSLLQRPSEASPKKLSGRFTLTPRFAVCGVTWHPTD